MAIDSDTLETIKSYIDLSAPSVPDNAILISLLLDYTSNSNIYAALAQSVEHIIRNDGVRCSNHLSGTTTITLVKTRLLVEGRKR